MLISRQKGRYKRINAKQAISGSFYTQKMSWFTEPVKDFFEKRIQTNNHVLDPFAGGGDLLEGLSRRYHIICKGYDLLGKRWTVNDSLSYIPNPYSALICTNPPYLAKHSAKRKGIFEKVQHHYWIDPLKVDT